MGDKLTFFDFLKAIFTKRKLKYDKKTCNIFMILQYLSHVPNYSPIVNEANRMIGKLPDEAIYLYLFHAIPKGTRYISYIKKEKKDKEFEKTLDKLVKKYSISRDEAIKSLT